MDPFKRIYMSVLFSEKQLLLLLKGNKTVIIIKSNLFN